MRTLLTGIDAATKPILERLFDEGELETVRGLWESGASGELESQIPPWTASAWPSMYTGKNPGKHGVFGFLTFDGYDWDVVNATDVRSRTLWELLDFHGLTSVVVNVPVTHPPRPFDGALVPGYTAPESPQCHPEGTLDELRDALGAYTVYAPTDDLSRDEQLTWFRRLTRMRGEAFRELATRYDPDFGFVQFQQTDTVFHQRPDDFDAVRTVYGAVDEQVAEILAACEPDTVIVASDHGMGRYEKQTFRVNQFLADAGYLTVKSGGEGMPAWTTIREEQLREGEGGDETGTNYLGRVLAATAKIGLTSERIAAALDAVGLADVVARYVSPSTVRAGMTQVDFLASRAYVRDSIELGIRLNLEGREPEGVVPESAYEELRAELIEQLRTVETPGGERVFDEVAPREEYFHGPAADDAVDIVTVPSAFDFQLSTRLEGGQFGPLEEPWSHKLEGVVVASGTAVDDEQSLGEPHLFDVAPTVLATFDLPYGTEMDGEPLSVVGDPNERSYPELSLPATVRTDDPAVERQLADLGYIETP
jgi:predicted AlkP superfamily phosphohydrolase/phosphomutase